MRSTRVCAALATITMLTAASPLTARADALDGLALPTVTKAPWRFRSFPIAAWWGPPGTATRADFQAYKDAGFTLHATNLDTGFDAALLQIEAVGLHSITLREPGDFELPPRVNPVPPTNRPAIVGWMLGDEPSGDVAVAQSITKMNTLLRQDPTRWTFFNMLPPNLQSPSTSRVIDVATANGMPIVSFDDYTIFANGSELSEQFYGNLSTVRDASLRNDAPFWAFAVTIQHSGYAGTYRRPSESDLRFMQFSNLAFGAKGLWYFTYWGASTLPGFAHVAIVGNDGATSELYPMVRAINETVLDIGDTLLGLRSIDVVHTNPPPGQKALVSGQRWISDICAKDALVGFFEDAANVPYAFVVNKRHAKGQSAAAMEDTLKVTFASSVGAVEAVSWLDGTPGPLTLSGGATTMKIAGGTGVLLKLTAGAAPPFNVSPPVVTSGVETPGTEGPRAAGDLGPSENLPPASQAGSCGVAPGRAVARLASTPRANEVPASLVAGIVAALVAAALGLRLRAQRRSLR